MSTDKDISEVIEEEALKLEAGDDSPDVTEVEEEVVLDEAETDEPETTEEEEAEVTSETEEEITEQVEDALAAPENWSEDIRDAFSKADPTTQQVWLDQQKEFQRGFNTVSQEAAELRRGEEKFRDVQDVLDQVIPAWQSQGMSPAQGLGQLVQLGMAYASNPQDTILHLAKMAGLDINDIGKDAPYRTSDDIQRDETISQLQARLNHFENTAQSGRVESLESEINAFQAETDAEGNLAHPFFAESMGNIQNLFQRGFNGTLQEAYYYHVFQTPELRQKMMASVPAPNVPQTDQSRNAAAQKAINASSQRVKQARPAPNVNTELDDLSQEELVARIAAQMEAKGGANLNHHKETYTCLLIFPNW